MVRAFTIYAFFLCLLLAYANTKGWSLAGTLTTQHKWGAQGPAFNHK